MENLADDAELSDFSCYNEWNSLFPLAERKDVAYIGSMGHVFWCFRQFWMTAPFRSRAYRAPRRSTGFQPVNRVMGCHGLEACATASVVGI